MQKQGYQGPDESGEQRQQVRVAYEGAIQGKVNVEELRLQYARLLDRWGALGGRSVKADFLQVPNIGNKEVALVRVEARGQPGLFVGYGSADPLLLGSQEAGKLLECAELLAKLDALSTALRASQSTAGNARSGLSAEKALSSKRVRSPFDIPADLAAHQQIDLERRPQGEGARIYDYFHNLVEQMERRSRQLKEQDLRLLDQVAQHRHDLGFYTYTQALVMVSHAIEDEFVQKQLSAPFYAGFQYFSRLRPQEPRYRAMLRTAQRLMLFGIADWSPWYDARLETVPLDVQAGTGLERFWFVVVKGATWKSALLAEHLSGGFATPLSRRRYRGFWTFDPVIVERIAGTLDYARTLLPGAGR